MLIQSLISKYLNDYFLKNDLIHLKIHFKNRKVSGLRRQSTIQSLIDKYEGLEKDRSVVTKKNLNSINENK